ncbi:MAG: hypothetical protein IJ506_01785 [Clostridia bacterium]|nr:hypothetical protein [Clostridia bacterium]
MRKNKFLLLLAMSTVCSFCVFAGCEAGCQGATKNNNEPQSKIEREDNAITLELNKTVFSNMVIGDENLLYATFTEISGEKVEWESSKSEVATVEKVNENIAKIVAVNTGEAVITAKYGAFTQTCAVSVTQNGIYPALYLENGVKETAVIEKGGLFDLSTYVLFNGKQFDDMEVSYVLEDPTYGVIDEENKTFTAGDTVGTTTITLEGKWRNIHSELLKKTITLQIVSSTVVSVNNGEFSQIELYTVASLQGNAYKNEQIINSIKVEEDGQTSTDYSIAITDHQPADGTDREVAFWDGDKVVANAFGKANFTISVGEDYSISYPIEVKRPLVPYANRIEWFSYLDGELPTDEIFSQADGQMEIIDAYQDENVLRVENGKVFGVTSKATDAMSVETIEVYNDKVGYILNVETYAQVIDEPKDMNFMFDGNLNGYVYLRNNIVVRDRLAGAGSNAAFSGVFEGNGYKITIPMREKGVFSGQLKGTVRNVWFEITDVKDMGGYNSNALIATLATEGATLENIYVTLDETDAVAPTRGVCLFESVGGQTTIRNLVADFGGVFLESGYDVISSNYRTCRHGLLCQYFGKFDTECEYENLYFISSGLKYLSYSQTEAEPDKGSITYAGNDEALKLADSESEEKKNKTQNVLKTVKRYDTVTDLIAAGNDLSTFDTRYWDIKAGHPVWRAVQASVNGEETNNISLFNTANAQENTATIDVKVMGVSVPFTLAVESGNADILSIVDNKVTAKQGAIGSAVLVATYKVDNDEVKMRFNVDVLPALSNEVMYWSTSTQQAYFPDGVLQAGETLETVTDFETSTLLYSVIRGYNNVLLDNTGSVKTFRAIVRGSKGTILTLNVRSYTLMITKASDMDFLQPDTTITGSYALANDITVDEWTHVSLGDLSAVASSTSFNGVFDGNGYTLTFPQRAYGLFGNIGSTAIVKNVCFKITARSSINDVDLNPNTNKGGLLGVSSAGTFENIYVEVSGTANRNGIGLFGSLLTTSSLKNVVVDYGETYLLGTNGITVWGTKGYLTCSSQTPMDGAVLSNVYVIGENGTKYLHERGGSHKYTPKVVAENEYGGAESGEIVVVGVRRYDSQAKLIADESADLTGFDATYWDTTNGAPVWKNK